MASKSPDGETRETSDLARLWESAVVSYEQRTKNSLRLAPFRSIEEVMKGTDNLSNQFKDFRNDKSKTAHVRTVFKNNLGLIGKVVTTVQIVGGAASVGLSTRLKFLCLQRLGLPSCDASHPDIRRLWPGHASASQSPVQLFR